MKLTIHQFGIDVSTNLRRCSTRCSISCPPTRAKFKTSSTAISLSRPAGKYLDNIEPATGKSVLASCRQRFRAMSILLWPRPTRRSPTGRSTPAAERSQIILAHRRSDRARSGKIRARRIDRYRQAAFARATLDIPRAVSNFRFFATAILHTENEAHVTDGVAFNYTLRQPRGIVGLISPWNLPLYLLSWKIAPAIAVGNTAIAKPSELTPMTAYLALRNLSRSRFAARRAQHRARHRTKCRRGDHCASKDRHDLLYRRHRDRPQSRRSGRAAVQENLARARRQKSQHHFCRRRSRRRHRRQRALFVRESGPGLPVRFARFRRAPGLR